MACTKRRVSAETFLGSCPEQGSLANGVGKEIHNALKHRKNETLADSAPGLAAPPPHLFRTPFRHAYAGLRTCRRHESLSSQYALPALTRLVRRSPHRRFISLPGRHCHPPPIRLGRASDGTYRAVRPSGPSASSSCRRMLKFAANKRSAGTNSQTGRQRRTSCILLSTSLIQRTQLSTKTP